MVRPALKVAALAVLITTLLVVHQLAKFLVDHDLFWPSIALVFLSLPLLSRYLDD